MAKPPKFKARRQRGELREGTGSQTGLKPRRLGSGGSGDACTCGVDTRQAGAVSRTEAGPGPMSPRGTVTTVQDALGAHETVLTSFKIRRNARTLGSYMTHCFADAVVKIKNIFNFFFLRRKGPRQDEGPSWGARGGRTHQRLHDGVVGGVHVGVQREGALALAVVGGVAFRGDDPVLRGEGKSGG